MLEATRRIQSYTSGYTLDAFAAESIVEDASVYNIIIIGEAANHIPDDIKGQFPDIPWLRIRGMRNAAVHQYFELDVGIVWDTIEQDVPVLEQQIQHILDNL
jgi:uncharacterized protein with HEPN domain